MTRSQRPAFTIAEVVVSVSILAIMAALVVPNATRYLYHKRIQADADMLDSIAQAKLDFRTAIDLYAGKLSQFGTVIAINDSTICNNIAPSTALVAFAASDTGQWSGNVTPTSPGHAGPYLGFVIPKTGLRLNIGTALNQMRRTTANNVAGYIQVVVPQVTYADARALNLIVDGNDLPGANRTDTSGSVRWVAGPAGPRDTVTLTWNMGVQANCTG
ncbi:MAG: type II secretion system GspH family protein [Gemmatimonadota bacterium]|nr:type II secretion system GspH family protein [Gemmatimonadota bacterium]